MWRPDGWDAQAIVHQAVGEAIGSGQFNYELLVETGADAILKALIEEARIVDSDTLYVLTNDEDHPICVIILPLGGRVE